MDSNTPLCFMDMYTPLCFCEVATCLNRKQCELKQFNQGRIDLSTHTSLQSNYAHANKILSIDILA